MKGKKNSDLLKNLKNKNEQEKQKIQVSTSSSLNHQGFWFMKKIFI